ncbi:AAA family ATPase [Falsibacillus albus]|nr:AAA family ATPase [Falsibacillus albus]
MFLNKLEFNRGNCSNEAAYPFDLPVIQTLEPMYFHTPITIFVGENGSGKSTLLQGMAAEADLPNIGRTDWGLDPFLKSSIQLSSLLKLTWKVKTKKGFFLRAEDFIGFTIRLKQMKEEAQNELSRIEHEYRDRSSYAKSLAALPHNRTLHELKQRYEDGLEFRSHGESFLDFFEANIKPNGLYMLDEPETPLSPMRQLAFMSMIIDSINNGSQYIIITHSPLLMALPHSTIYSFNDHHISQIQYDEIEHVNLMRQFLDAPERFLKHL